MIAPRIATASVLFLNVRVTAGPRLVVHSAAHALGQGAPNQGLWRTSPQPSPIKRYGHGTVLARQDKPEVDAVNELIMTAAMVTQPSTSDGNTRNDLLIGFALLSRRISRPPSGLSCSS